LFPWVRNFTLLA